MAVAPQTKQDTFWALPLSAMVIVVMTSLITLPLAAFSLSRGLLTHGLFYLGFFFLMFAQLVFTRIRVNAEGARILLYIPGISRFYVLDNTRFMPNWKIVIFSTDTSTNATITYGFIVPLRFKELAEEIKLKTLLETPETEAPTEVSNGASGAILFIPMVFLILFDLALRPLGFSINPFIHLAIQVLVPFSSISIFVYKSWNRYRVGKLGRLGSALAYGLITVAMSSPLLLLSDLARASYSF